MRAHAEDVTGRSDGHRSKHRHRNGMTFRSSTGEVGVPDAEEFSQQKVLERIVWPALMEKYGKD